MRPVIALVILLLGLSSAAPEPEYPSLLAGYLQRAGGPFPELIEIESSTGRADRLSLAALLPHAVSVETLRRTDDAEATGTTDVSNATGGEASLDDLCNALFTSAQDNNLPIPFFANLIWQESRLRNDAVSRKGALGIAQFMPQTAAETGLDNPLDPMQAIPASARFLRTLRLEFGNLGFVAAAYNAGARRVAEWLEHRGSLPRETRSYVVRVTGLSAEAWRRIPIGDAALTFVRPLPCRSLPTFASYEQEQSAAAQIEQAKLADEEARLAAAERHDRVAERKRAPAHARHEARRAVHDRRAGGHEAEHRPRTGRDKRVSA